MPITTYDELQSAVESWLARADLAERIPDFITLGEQRIFYGADDPSYAAPPLRIRAMEAVTDPAALRTAPGVATVTLPAQFLEARALSLAGDSGPGLELAPLSEVLTRAHLRGRPRLFAFEGDAIRFAPTPDAEYGLKLAFYRRFDPLAVTPTNWLLLNAPGVYLYAALLEAQPFLMNDVRIPVWAGMFAAAIRALMHADRPERGGGPMRLRPDAWTP